MPVHFLYEINDTLQSEKTMRLKARGQFRRSHCNLAPFWLNIRKADVKNAHLQDINRIKIVTHCKGAKAYEEYVLKEYLAYKIYNILSPVSFRVRLLKMTYVDSGRKNRITEGWAFMIEPEAMLAQRTGALVVKKDELTTRLMRPGEIDVVALFQYMIGNADYSGLVDAYYAIPGENLGLTSVRDRYYLGPCREDEDFIAAMEHINQFREEIIQLVTGCEYLDPEYKNGAIHYLEEYFELAGHHQPFIQSLQRTCR